MNRAAKKLAVIEMLKQKYDRTSRLHGGEIKHDLDIRLHIDEFPPILELTLDELFLIISDIERDYKKKITVRSLNDNKLRVKRNYYPVRVQPKTFSSEVRSNEKPTVTPHGGYWCITLPGQNQLIRVSRRGSFNGELFAILCKERFGMFQTVDHVLEKLRDGRVTDERTKGYQSAEAIKEHLKEINERLDKAINRTLKRIGAWPTTVGVIWGNFFWNAILRTNRGVATVGFVRVSKPTRMKEKASK